jgi:hypothetical protein
MYKITGEYLDEDCNEVKIEYKHEDVSKSFTFIG